MTRLGTRRSGATWGWLTAAIVAPALCIGGVHPWVVPAFGLVVLGLWRHTCRHGDGSLRVPWVALAGVFTAMVVVLQWLPLSPLRALDPTTSLAVDAALASAGVEPWPGMSVTPGDTALEAGRVIALTGLFVAAAQVSWRVSAALVVIVATAAAAVGFGHDLLGLTTIYGVYAPQQPVALAGPALRVPFVNPNHQASLLLLGAFAAGALAVERRTRARASPDPDRADRYRNHVWLSLGALAVLLPALLLTLSRGGITAALVTAPFALVLARRAPGSSSPATWRHRGRRVPIVTACFVGVLVLVARHGAWAELSTLAQLPDPHSSAARKMALAGEALRLVAWSRPLGIGRGAFKDLFGAIEAAPGSTWFTHPESMPAVLVVELGWLAGSLVVLALAVWWVDAFFSSARHPDAVARRIALLGLAALGLHCALEFSLELLGVAAPAVALAASLSGRSRTIAVARVRPAVTWALVGAIGLAAWGMPHSESARVAQDRAIHDGIGDRAAALRMRPMDGRLWGLLARRAAAGGDWARAEAWARRATTLRPGLVDPWLLLAAAERERGLDNDATMRLALARLAHRPDSSLVDYLLAAHPSPTELAAVVPEEGRAWTWLVDALRTRAPGHADAIAAARIERGDVAAQRVRAELALAAERPALALHHARLWRAADGGHGASHVAVARALQKFDPPRLDDARVELEAALRGGALSAVGERARVEDVLVQVLVAIGSEAALARARDLLEILRSRPGDRSAGRRRARLRRQLAER